ncbi:hypothetical protein F0562_029503 [Nyssa sinensis]|uniref:Uncharacterized protein n=1 Tax=Nyssa sinensis TaxID=561372 RepID=A0A5J5B178_9ASTE|nr:hypothetical protein F0562_029503 [Nyssa sinensis]
MSRSSNFSGHGSSSSKLGVLKDQENFYSCYVSTFGFKAIRHSLEVDGLLVEVLALTPEAHVFGFVHSMIVDSELVETVVGPNHARDVGSGVDEVVVSYDRAWATGSGLHEAVIGLDHVMAASYKLDEAAASPNHVQAARS